MRKALDGRVHPHHQVLLTRILAHIDFLEESLAQLQKEMEQYLTPFDEAVTLVASVVGIGEIAAGSIIAEIGTDMTRFASDKHSSSQTPFPTHGGTGGTFADIQFDPGDTLTGISGFSGLWFGGNYILQLTFHTHNGKTYGPYGDMQYASTPTAFSLLANANEQVVAFFGSTASGNNGQAQYLGSIGLTVESN